MIENRQNLRIWHSFHLHILLCIGYTSPETLLETCKFASWIASSGALTFVIQGVGKPMTASGVRGIDLFKIAGRSISGWIPSLKTGNLHHVSSSRNDSQLEERLFMYLEYHLQGRGSVRGDIDARFAAIYRLPTPKVLSNPKSIPKALGSLFEGKPHIPPPSTPAHPNRRRAPVLVGILFLLILVLVVGCSAGAPAQANRNATATAQVRSGLGKMWHTQLSGTSQTLPGVAWSGTQFVAVGDGTILTSPDGHTWTAQSSDTSYYLESVAWSGSQFVVVGENGTILTSP